jgi:hypothetical protein
MELTTSFAFKIFYLTFDLVLTSHVTVLLNTTGYIVVVTLASGDLAFQGLRETIGSSNLGNNDNSNETKYRAVHI